MKILNLGDVKGSDYFSYADYPLVNDINEIWMVCSRITDDHFSIGRNKNIDDYLKEDVDRSKFTFSRYLEEGGLMWLKDICTFRVVFDNDDNKSEKYNSVVAILVDIIRHECGGDIYPDDNYLFRDGKKVAGFMGVSINGKLSCHCYANLLYFLPEGIKKMYKHKKFNQVGCLNNQLSYEKFIDDLSQRLASRWNSKIIEISRDDLDVKNLKNINSSNEWIYTAKRGDIEL